MQLPSGLHQNQVETTIKASMPDYFEDLGKRFECRMNVKIQGAETPWLDTGAEKRYKDELLKPGKYGYMAASPLMSGLYGSRSCRPDLIIPTLRGARRLTKWIEYDDRRLLR